MSGIFSLPCSWQMHLVRISVLCLFFFLNGCGNSSGDGGNQVSWTGSKQIGAPNNEETSCNSVAIDSGDNIYLTGYTTGRVNGNLQMGTGDLILVKYDSNGNHQFTRQLGVAGAETLGSSLAIDSGDNVYVAGWTKGGLDGNALIGTRDLILVKYDSNGNRQFTRQFGVAGAETLSSGVAIDSGDNIYLTGYTGGGLDGNTVTGTMDFFLTKYDSSGTRQYTRQLGVTAEITYSSSVTIDSGDNVYLAGYTTGGLDGNTLTGKLDFFLTKYDNNGIRQFTRQLGTAAAYTAGNDAAINSSDYVYLAGGTDGGLDGNTLTGDTDFFVTKYDSTGTRQYTSQLGVAGAVTADRGVAVDNGDNVYVTGLTNGGLDGNTLSWPGHYDMFLTKYDNGGSKLYTRQLGVAGGADTKGHSVAVDSHDNVFVTGVTYGGLDGNTRIGIIDCFVTKYDSTGAKQ